MAGRPLRLVLLFMLFALALSPNVVASGGVSITFTWESATSSLRLRIQSDTGVGAAQVKIQIPSEVTVGSASADGFMIGFTYLSLGTESRWFILNANGMKEGGVTIPLTIPGDRTFEVRLTGVDLKDRGGNIIKIDTPLPVKVAVGKVATTAATSETLSTTSVSASTSSSATTTESIRVLMPTVRVPATGTVTDWTLIAAIGLLIALIAVGIVAVFVRVFKRGHVPRVVGRRKEKK